ncbi:MAG TPA: tRNA (adenosine(37)-N6)-threonylcarbamoyltransferase complex dimerization subunit type 1 TsaB [Syntrophorhabdaceae bacterium]|nr:tRNA (adenosine(37)-N6)-threonylcarbamoyltransferase complex dimerization subunit type 1 TsaB [Syntrophorhabdaceae bacterium]HPP06491.1 tRNA (adenosine(37)-N6)-threonylcarbamoyltransferase complex dimerization subunit type 1 TsaB [Syntrophorhabdaceae bacterium]
MESKLIFGIDNSMDELVMVLSLEQKLIEERHIKAKKNTSEIIGTLFMDMLTLHDYSVNDLNLIIVTLGPGTFTGIRVGLAFCKGLASGLNLPVIGVSTLDVLGAYFSAFEGYHVFPVIDAKKGEVFFSLYYVENGELLRKTDIASKRPVDAIRYIMTPCICFGSGIALCEPYISHKEDIILIKDGYKRITGEKLIKTGLRLWDKKEMGALTPVYGRKSEAEIKLSLP